jgi:hypothetical protein
MAFRHKLNLKQEYAKLNYLNYFRSKILFAFLKLLDDEEEYKNFRQPLKFDDCDDLLINKDLYSNKNENNNDNNINDFCSFAIEITEFDKSIHTDALYNFIKINSFSEKKNYTYLVKIF